MDAVDYTSKAEGPYHFMRLCCSAIALFTTTLELKNMKLILVVFLSIFINACAVVEKSKNGNFEYFVIYGVERLIPSKVGLGVFGNVAPWEYASFSEKEFVVGGNACHFYEIDYVAESAHQSDSSSSNVVDKAPNILVQPGEFCDLREYVFAHPTLAVTKYWDGNRYLIDHAPLRFGEKSFYFVIDFDFIEKYNFEDLYVALDKEKDIEACDYLDVMSEIEIEDLKRHPFVTFSKKEACYSKGVYLSAIQEKISSYKQRNEDSGVSAPPPVR